MVEPGQSGSIAPLWKWIYCGVAAAAGPLVLPVQGSQSGNEIVIQKQIITVGRRGDMLRTVPGYTCSFHVDGMMVFGCHAACVASVKAIIVPSNWVSSCQWGTELFPTEPIRLKFARLPLHLLKRMQN